MIIEFLKRNIFLTLIIIALFISTIALGFIIKKLNNEVENYEKDVKLIIESEKNFANSPYALTAANVNQAEANYEIAVESFQGLVNRLNERYPAPEVNANMTALKFKNFLRQVCIRVENLLRSGDIWMPDALKYFTYDKYMQPDVLPSGSEIKLIMEQLEIVQEIMYLVSQSQVTKLLDFKRLNDLQLVKRELYDYMPFSLTLTGNVESLQRFLNSLNEAKYFIMVRSLNINAAPIPQNKPPVNQTRNKDRLLSKRNRLVFNKKAELKASILLDFFIFHNKD